MHDVMRRGRRGSQVMLPFLNHLQSSSKFGVASSPGHPQILSRSCGETRLRDKIWEWTWNKARFGEQTKVARCGKKSLVFIHKRLLTTSGHLQEAYYVIHMGLGEKTASCLLTGF